LEINKEIVSYTGTPQVKISQKILGVGYFFGLALYTEPLTTIWSPFAPVRPHHGRGLGGNLCRPVNH